MMDNCSVYRRAIEDAISIFGPSLPNLQDKSMHSTQHHVNLEHMTSVPHIILQGHKNVVIGMDLVKYNGVRFVVTYSCILKLCTATELQNVEIPTLIKLFTTIKVLYLVRKL